MRAEDKLLSECNRESGIYSGGGLVSVRGAIIDPAPSPLVT
ncbi:MAG: hypothetical protein OJF50_006716 [Nitrospira sp.]|nr:hypothetical protein [Nitrospira sp.]